VQLASEAYNRRDLDAVVIGYHPEVEYHPARNWVEAGFFEPCYRGPEGYREYVATTAEVFGAEVYFKPAELIDLGERIVVLATAPMRAQASGVPLTETFAYVWTVKDGKIIRLQEYYDHDEALAEGLEAAGLSEHGTEGQ
jgi:ketosteroid isomerase-like protein